MVRSAYLNEQRPDFDEQINQFITQHPDYFDAPDALLGICHQGKIYRQIGFNHDAHFALLDFFYDQLGLRDLGWQQPEKTPRPYALLFDLIENT